MARQQILLRIGAVCVVVGSVIVLACRRAHGDLPTDTGEAALSYVASYPIYALVHLGDVLGVLVWAGGLVALSGALTHRVASAVGRLGAVSVLVGAAVHIAEFSIDGYALPTLAETWAVASPSERPDLEFGASEPWSRSAGPERSNVPARGHSRRSPLPATWRSPRKGTLPRRKPPVAKDPASNHAFLPGNRPKYNLAANNFQVATKSSKGRLAAPFAGLGVREIIPSYPRSASHVDIVLLD
jgi:hypothetical protein